MQQRLHHRHDVNVSERVYITTDEIAEIYRNLHSNLNKTYWNTAANHKICADAMKFLKRTHILKKNGRFLMILASIVYEVYSHAHYNAEELFHEDRNIARRRYWAEILSLYEMIMGKAEKLDSMRGPFHSGYMWWAISEIRHQTFDLHAAIEARVYLNQSDRQVGRISLPTLCPPHTLENKPLTEEDLVANAVTVASSLANAMSKNELFSKYDKALAKHKNMMVERKKVHENDISNQTLAPCGIEISKKKTKFLKDDHGLSSTNVSEHYISYSVMTESDLEQAIKNLDSAKSGRCNSLDSPHLMANDILMDKSSEEKAVLMNSSLSTERRSTAGCCDPYAEIADNSHQVSGSFNFREEFERRFNRNKIKTYEIVELPVIGKSRKSDIVRSRRKGPFDDVEHQKPVLVDQTPACSVGSTDVSVASDLEREKLHYKEVHPFNESIVEPNNNTLISESLVAEKITNAELLENSASLISSPLHQRASAIT
ncbi:hypothetical protein KIN20_022205 [Parelaphostrongylus tenuis]|uniref:Uncharacterized protein n=1 Tax=Parelaphostrongylus tenuis TaxID=148309 RepID=A0AAD5N7S7_PARTN|nr:hypothetical protein KIN20_022205 [Parelaphostrongylus tenuis]